MKRIKRRINKSFIFYRSIFEHATYLMFDLISVIAFWRLDTFSRSDVSNMHAAIYIFFTLFSGCFWFIFSAFYSSHDVMVNAKQDVGNLNYFPDLNLFSQSLTAVFLRFFEEKPLLCHWMSPQRAAQRVNLLLKFSADSDCPRLLFSDLVRIFPSDALSVWKWTARQAQTC